MQKKNGFSNRIMESYYKIYQGKILSISKSVSQSGPKIYNHKYFIHTVGKKKHQNKCSKNTCKNEGVFILYLALEDDLAAIIVLFEKSTLCKMVE